jgi:hypothetical protein
MLEFFDCNCSYGEEARPAPRYAATPADLLEQMDFCGIDRGLVYHAGQRADSPPVWNPQVVTDLAGSDRLQPTWALLPPQTGEQPPTAEFLAQMRAAGVRALWAFPEEHRYRLDGRTFGELFEALAERRVPLFVKASLITIRI